MYDDFFFPYEKAKLWTGNMFLLSLSNFLLYASLYMMLPVLPLWMVRHWYCSYAEAGAAIAVFGLAMFLPGTFNSYLIDTFKRKSVCFIAIFLFVASSLPPSPVSSTIYSTPASSKITMPMAKINSKNVG